MKYNPILSLGTLLLILGGCSSKVIHFANSNSTFSSYEDFGIVNYKKTKDLSPEGEEVFSFIEDMISEQMTKRDYLLNQKDPDLVIRYELIRNQKSEVNSSYYNPYSYYRPFPTYSVTTFQESALLIELFDTETKKLVWQASLDLDKASKKNSTEQILNNAIVKLFNTYLYRAKTNSTDESLIVE
ncbi:DUF4136 domain-containing protein [Marinoscillum pacificum]|uniref:DUF4136 domain-containing protein n=1 Tax=Marinoscillum pacificum TaxID=392723 RepID=UPI00215896E7|nr:DUF4136 domain-containing protein [Marinoscillum pacificum]